MADVPEYIIRPSILRVVVPQIFITSFLGFIFYIGIALNVALLGVRIPNTIRLLIAAVLGLLVVIQALLSYLQTAKTQYAIYRNRVQIEGAKQGYVMFSTIQEVKQKRNFFDKLFNTASLVFVPGLELPAVSNYDQLNAYVQQMMQYSRMQYQQV
jgi:hypothetical protein